MGGFFGGTCLQRSPPSRAVLFAAGEGPRGRWPQRGRGASGPGLPPVRGRTEWHVGQTTRITGGGLGRGSRPVPAWNAQGSGSSSALRPVRRTGQVYPRNRGKLVP